MKTIVRLFLASAMVVLAAQSVKAQDVDALGTYTPYSLYGIGALEGNASTINSQMGGIGIAVRDRRFINYKNVASLTQRDTLSFMLDFGITLRNFYLKDKNTSSAYNSFNMVNFVLSAPIKNKTAFVFGITPYSNIGYKFQTTETSSAIVSKYGDVKYEKYGSGGLNQVFFGVAALPVKNLSVGAQLVYYFGELKNHSDIKFNSAPSLRTIRTGWEYKPTGFTGEFGAQYTLNAGGDDQVVFGATYRMRSKLRGRETRYAYSSDDDRSTRDTVTYNSATNKVTIPSRMSLGVSYRRGEKWMVGFDYQRQDWSKTTFRNTPGVDFSPKLAQSFQLGFEFVPNRYDIRYYYKRITYRFGAYYDQSYMKVGGKDINQMGLTFGMSFPILRLHNSLNFAVDVGQRGSTSNNLVRERYVNFSFSLNLHDLWFIKPRYE